MEDLPEGVERERALPHSVEAEQTVLGVILIDNSKWHAIQKILTATDFYKAEHQRIFRAMERLVQDETAIDLVSLRKELHRTQDLAPAGGVVYLTSLLDGVPRATSGPYYSRIVKEQSVLRSLIASANRIIDSCFDMPEEQSLTVSSLVHAIEANEGGLADAIRKAIE